MRRKKRAKEEFGKEALAEGATQPEAPAPAAPVPAETPAPATSGAAAQPASHITPVDIQQKMFKRVVKGYSETEVDAFLDEVTEGLARLLAEHKRLREQVELLGMRATTPLDASSAAGADALTRNARDEAARILGEARQQADEIVAGAAGRAPSAPAGDARWFADLTKTFVSREREFLQGLASMIQQHAEAVREDLRRTQGTAPPAREVVAPAPDIAHPGPAADPADDDAEPDDSGGAGAEAAPEAVRPADASGTPAATGAPPEPEDAFGPQAEPVEPAVAVDVEVGAEDPHRPWRPVPTRPMALGELSDDLEEPTKAAARTEAARSEPARTEAGEGDDDKHSLRELFWGED